MLRSKILVAVCTIVLLAGSLQATETPSLLDKQRAMFDKLDDILGGEFFWNVDPQKLDAAVQLLRESESLFPESERVFGQLFWTRSMWDRYLQARVGFLGIATQNAEDTEKKEGSSDKCVPCICCISQNVLLIKDLVRFCQPNPF